MYDKKVPIPDIKVGRKLKWDHSKMQLGESTFIEYIPSEYKSFASFRYSVLQAAQRQFGSEAKAVARIEEKKGLKGVRLWKSDNYGE